MKLSTVLTVVACALVGASCGGSDTDGSTAEPTQQLQTASERLDEGGLGVETRELTQIGVMTTAVVVDEGSENAVVLIAAPEGKDALSLTIPAGLREVKGADGPLEISRQLACGRFLVAGADKDAVAEVGKVSGICGRSGGIIIVG